MYLYGLPYHIENPDAYKEAIEQAFGRKIGRIQQIEIFSFKDYLDISERETKIKSFDNLKDLFTPKNAAENTADLATTSTEVNVDLENYLEDHEVDPTVKEKATKKLEKTAKILKKMKEKDDRRLDRSYALIEFSSYEEKQKALTEDMRVFGILVKGKLCNVDDADYKLTLTCYNVHWGSYLKDFCAKINQVFEENNMAGICAVSKHSLIV